MPIAVVVRRGSGTRPGEDIYDPLITALPVALARGRNELDEQSSGLQPVDLNIPFRIGLRMGQVVKVIDTLFGTIWYGKIESLRHAKTIDGMITTVRLKRPTEFVL